jgi:hypothetical protein
MAILPRFYVYILYRPDGRPFYVGKGQGNRIHAHESFARNGYKARRYSIIRKIWREGGEVLKQKVFETESEDEAYDMERYLIASIGRENLANENDGGTWNYGYRPSVEVRAKMSRSMRGVKHSPEWHAKVQAAKIGKPRSEACKAKIRERLTGRTLPPEHVEAAAAGHRGQVRSEETKRRISEAQKGKRRPWQDGEKHHGAKWTITDVRMVRQLHRDGMKSKAIAQHMGMTKGCVGSIIHRRTWKWVDNDDGNC